MSVVARSTDRAATVLSALAARYAAFLCATAGLVGARRYGLVDSRRTPSSRRTCSRSRPRLGASSGSRARARSLCATAFPRRAFLAALLDLHCSPNRSLNACARALWDSPASVCCATRDPAPLAGGIVCAMLSVRHRVRQRAPERSSFRRALRGGRTDPRLLGGALPAVHPACRGGRLASAWSCWARAVRRSWLSLSSLQPEGASSQYALHELWSHEALPVPPCRNSAVAPLVMLRACGQTRAEGTAGELDGATFGA